jgi:protein TonB
MAEMIFKLGEYGATELKQKVQQFSLYGLILAAAIHFGAIGTYWASVYWGQEEPPTRMIKIMKYSDLGPPPSISGANEAVAPSVSVAGPQARPSIGVPVPVPDAEVNPDQTFATQQELSAVGPETDGSGLGDGSAVIEQDIQIEDDTAPADFVPYQQAPQIVKRVEPPYPDIARRAGLEGKVWVKIWVDKEGKVRDVVIMKSDSEIFNQSVVDACKQWVWTPALMNSGPVAVWVAMNFVFKLNQGK